MKLKKTISLLAIIFSLINTTFSQINIGSKETIKLNSGKFSDEDIKALKESKTVFLYRKDDDIEKLKKAIQSVWDYTEISFKPNDYIDRIDFNTTSVFSINSVSDYESVQGAGLHTYIFLSLWMKTPNKKGELKKKTFCRIELHPTTQDVFFAQGQTDEAKKHNYFYTQATLRNWNIGFLKVYLNFVNQNLKNNERKWFFESIKNTENLKKLATGTLYIPDYTFNNYDKFTGKEETRLSILTIMKKYIFNYKVKKAESISEIILDPDSEPIYFLVYIRSSSDKFITVFDSESAEILYSDYSGMKYNVKSKDFKKLAKAIKRSR